MKHKIYKTVIRPTMTYGAECWTMKNKDEMLMNKTEMRMFYRVCSIQNTHKIQDDGIFTWKFKMAAIVSIRQSIHFIADKLHPYKSSKQTVI